MVQYCSQRAGRANKALMLTTPATRRLIGRPFGGRTLCLQTPARGHGRSSADASPDRAAGVIVSRVPWRLTRRRRPVARLLDGAGQRDRLALGWGA